MQATPTSMRIKGSIPAIHAEVAHVTMGVWLLTWLLLLVTVGAGVKALVAGRG